MSIEFDCTSCTKKVRVPDGSEGRKCKCPGCQTVLVVPEAEVESVEIKLEVACPRCEFILICDPALEGTRGLCPNCKFIFTIGPPGTNDTEEIADIASSTFAFQCPHCKQLFEGKSGMEGRKGKCIHCMEVFEIKLQNAPQTAGANSKPLAKKTPVTEQQVAPKRNAPIPASVSKPTKAPVETTPPTTDFPAVEPFSGQTNSNDWLAAIPSQASNVNPYAEPLNPYTASASLTGSGNILSDTSTGDAVSIRKDHLSHESAIKGFALLYAISAAFSILGAVAAICFFAYVLVAGTGVAVAVIVLVYAFVYLIVGALTGMVAHGLYRLNDVGKVGGVIFAVLGLCALPFGTALGVYLLYLLFSAKGNVVFSERYRTVVKQTPQIRATIPIFVWVLLALIAFLFVGAMLLTISGIRRN